MYSLNAGSTFTNSGFPEPQPLRKMKSEAMIAMHEEEASVFIVFE
jgi:hypothetical protein